MGAAAVPAPSTDTDWTPWRPFPAVVRFDPASLAETLDGGQAFRWLKDAGTPPTWTGRWGRNIVRLRLEGGGDDTGVRRLRWSAPAVSTTILGDLLRYFSGHVDTAALLDQLPWRSDPHLRAAMGRLPTLRLLRQPFGETLLGFLCSSNKRVVQIKQICENLAARLGEPLDPAGRAGLGHALPTWERLAGTSEAELRACKLGYRARFVAATAEVLARRPGWLHEIETSPYPEARSALCQLPGVGEKIADCVLLFGAGRLEAFPVDTWILKAMARLYGLDGWKPTQVAHFGRTHFGPAAGLAQQFLFGGERGRG